MDVYFAGAASSGDYIFDDMNEISNLYVLESFYYADNDVVKKYIPLMGKFLLDSGAFTFMASNNKKKMDWDDYVERYANFINENKIDLFFELDIDSIVGITEVERLRTKLENLTNKQCIPVWHKSRGKDYFLNMCDKYSYVSIGGLVTKEITPDEYKYFPWFIKSAHEREARIHALGYTNFLGLKKYHFDSVDSSSWSIGHRFGSICQFKDGYIINITRNKNERMKDYKAVAKHNFKEWIKFQEYAKEYL